MWPKMSTAVRNADFIAVDCELSGLGNRKKLGSSDMDERYSNLSVVAKTRSVLALGISCFKKSAVDVTNYCVQTFNILTLCDEDYIVEPGSIKFLLQHGFNFQEQYSRGVLYRRGDEGDKVVFGHRQKKSIAPVNNNQSSRILQSVQKVRMVCWIDVVFVISSPSL